MNPAVAHPVHLVSTLVLLLAMALMPLASEAATIAVTCTNPGDLQAAVNAAAEFDTLNVSGTCTETFLTISSNRNGLALDGGGTAIIQDLQAGVGASGITVRGAHQVRIQNFANITSNTTDGTGVFVVDGGAANVLSNVIDGNFHGVEVFRNAQAIINGNTFSNNADTGIFIGETSSARIGFSFPVTAPNTIQNNGFGIQVSRGSSARIIGNNISNNARAGILVQRGSQADIASNTIQSNVNGIEVLRNSSVVLGNDTGIGPVNDPNSGTNTGFGVFCRLNSSVDGRRGALDGTSKPVRAQEACANSTIP